LAPGNAAGEGGLSPTTSRLCILAPLGRLRFRAGQSTPDSTVAHNPRAAMQSCRRRHSLVRISSQRSLRVRQVGKLAFDEAVGLPIRATAPITGAALRSNSNGLIPDRYRLEFLSKRHVCRSDSPIRSSRAGYPASPLHMVSGFSMIAHPPIVDHRLRRFINPG
jgi:hypothetical protein